MRLELEEKLLTTLKAGTIVGVDTLGAWFSGVLLRASSAPPSENDVLSWRGDRLIGIRTGEGNLASIVWLSAWGTEERAAEVANALERIHHVGSEMNRAGERVTILHQGARVALFRNLDESHEEKLRELALTAVAVEAPKEHRISPLIRLNRAF